MWYNNHTINPLSSLFCSCPQSFLAGSFLSFLSEVETQLKIIEVILFNSLISDCFSFSALEIFLSFTSFEGLDAIKHFFDELLLGFL